MSEKYVAVPNCYVCDLKPAQSKIKYELGELDAEVDICDKCCELAESFLWAFPIFAKTTTLLVYPDRCCE